MQAQSDWLQERYDYAGWREQPATGPSLVGIGFRLRGDELPGWRIHRSRSVQLAGAAPAVLSIWSPVGAGGGLLAVDVYESVSTEAARSRMLTLLGEFQGPALERESAVGDVAFRAGTGTVLFVRGNYTILVRSVEREPVAVLETAERLDRHFTTVPENAIGEGGPVRGASTPVTGVLRAGQRAAIDLDIELPAEGGVWLRFFASSGRVLIEAGRAWYVAGPDGPQDVVVVGVDPAGVASRATVRFDRGGETPGY